MGRATGIDVGRNGLLVTAAGAAVDPPRHDRRGEQQLKRAQRRVARRQKGSHRRKKALQWLAKAQQPVTRQRADHQHKTALTRLRDDDTLALAEGRVAKLLRTHHRAKRSADAGWAPFRTVLAGKAAAAGKRVVAIPPPYTTQAGSGGGARVPKRVRVRTHTCPCGGVVLDREVHAANNIVRAGQARQGAVAVAVAVAAVLHCASPGFSRGECQLTTQRYDKSGQTAFPL